MHGICEKGRVAVRNHRRDIMHDLRELKGEGEVGSDEEHRAEQELQKLTDEKVVRARRAAEEQGSGDPRGVSEPSARYVAIITDGNGRWAKQRGLPVVEGHRAGADTVKARLRDAVDLGVQGADRLLLLDRELVALARRGGGPDGDVRRAHRPRDARAARGGRADALHRAARGRPAGPRGADGLGGAHDERQLAHHAVRGLQLRRPGGDRGRGAKLHGQYRGGVPQPTCTRPRCTIPT